MSDHQLPAVPNFPELEQKWLTEWKQKNIFNAYLTKNKSSKKRFSFIDGPITANNPMGVHHGWGRTYKDLWQKFHNLLGYQLRFQNGFDCQGLWVEVEVEKELKIHNKKDIENLVPGDRFASIDRFVTLCKERVIKFSGVQTQQSQRLGYFMDWDHSYFTMDPENNYMIWQFLSVCHHKKWLYKGHESVPWCPRCETAISQHEMLTEDYKEMVHDSIYLKLPIVGRKNEYLLIWTTTPWTIPANIAVAVNEKLEYALVEGTTGDQYWVAKDSVPSVFGKDTPKTIKTVLGKELVGTRYTGAFDQLEAVAKVAHDNPDTFHTVIATDELIMPISTTEGTGLVHTAVSAGTEDFKLGKKYGLPMIPIIADNADYLPHLGELSGKNAKKHPEIIFDYLKEREAKHGENWIFAIVPYKHRYPACWRCKTELVWKIADEWYIAMDRPDETDSKKRTFRQQMIDVANSITWMPSFGLERELDWLNNMHDWLISKKNRYWGLALPIYECPHCKTFEVISSEKELEERAVSGFDRFKGHTPHKPWIDEVKIACTSCKKPLSRIDDVGNPWLDAGIVPYSTLSYRHDKAYWKQWFPADFITESFPGQFKNWFYAMIAMSTALERTAPFKRVLGYATLMDEHGKPMHKSSGNMIEFNEAANKIGVDVMRWIYVTQDPKKNALFGYHKAGETQRAFHLPLWNILKFYHTYAQLDQWKQDGTVTYSLLDTWLLSYWSVTMEKVYRSLSQFKPDMASLALQEFVTNWSNWYIRLSRQRVWTNSDNNADKQALYTTLHRVLSDFCVTLSPFLPFYSEELNSHINTTFESVHLKNWPEMSKEWRNTQLNADMEKLKTLAELGHSVRKEQGIKVRQALAGITYTLPSDQVFALPKHEAEYKRLLSSELNIKDVFLQYDKKTTQASAQLDTAMTPELEQEGKLRDIIREIQQKRKEMGCQLTEWVAVTLPHGFKPDEQYIAHRVLAKNISFHDADTVEVKRIT